MQQTEKEKIVENVKKSSKWKRGLFMLLFFAVSEICKTILFSIAAFQFVHHLILDKPNANLLEFSKKLVNYYQSVYHFLTYLSENKPFPFDEWPQS